MWAVKRYRKAIVAGLGAAVTTGASAVMQAGPEYTDGETVSIILTTLAAGVLVGMGTYQVRNEGSDIGPTGSTVRTHPTL